MSLTYAQLEQFYESLVSQARRQGIPCAITSGMACVAMGIAQTTKDCDLLCAPDSAKQLLDLLSQTSLQGHLPGYRGHLSAPLDARWLTGGWTSHFAWNTSEPAGYLDVFGIVPRGSSRWEVEIEGFYANPHTVAEMKRTKRDKDWPFVTALGARMLEAGDERGWLHIYDEDVLRAFARVTPVPPKFLKRRPLLELAIGNEPTLRVALLAEIQFWHELDRARLHIYETASRKYWVAVKHASPRKESALAIQHEIRVRCAESHLPVNPLRDYGVARMIAEAREKVSLIVNPVGMRWLPDVSEHFKLLI